MDQTRRYIFDTNINKLNTSRNPLFCADRSKSDRQCRYMKDMYTIRTNEPSD